MPASRAAQRMGDARAMRARGVGTFGNIAPSLFLIAGALFIAASFTARATTPAIEHIEGTPPLDRAPVAKVDTALFGSGEFIARDGTRLVYRLLPPSKLEPGRRYPLVLQLHGSGAIGSDNTSQLDVAARAWALPEIRERYAAFVLVPQFPVRSANYDDPDVPHSAVASPALAAALELIDQISAGQPIDPDRLYATGFSMGGSAAWLVATLQPDRFAALMPISGIAPDDRHAGVLAALPILVLHGAADPENPIDADRRLAARISAVGGHVIRLREYVGLQHMPPGDLLPGYWWRDWLFGQRRIASQTHDIHGVSP